MTKLKDLKYIDTKWIDERLQSLIKLRDLYEKTTNTEGFNLVAVVIAELQLVSSNLYSLAPIIEKVMDSLSTEEQNEIQMRNTHGYQKGKAFEIYVNNTEIEI